MNAQELRDNVLRAEGFAQGFKEGYSSCAKMVAENLAKEESLKKDQKQEG